MLRLAMRDYAVAILAYHPMPYHVAFYRAVHADARLRETVLFLDRYGIEGRYDPEFRTEVKWDAPLLEGYRHKFVRNLTSGVHSGPAMRINPGLIPEIALGRYDAVLITGYDTLSAWFALFAAKLSGKKVILRAEADLTNPSQSLKRRLKERFLGRVLKLFPAILYSCERNRRYFKHFGATGEKLFPIPSAADNAQFLDLRRQAARRRSDLRRVHGIPEDAAVALFVGRLIDRKRPGDLFDAVKRLHARSPRLWAVFVGDGPLRSGMETGARAAGLDRMVFAGFKNLSEMAGYYFMADIFVMPSQYDPTPKAVNEAMICGLPVVVSSGVGTAEDLVVHDVSGLVYETGDVDALAAAIERLGASPALRRRIGDAAQRAASKWSPEAGVQGLVEALEFCFDRT